MKRNAMVPQAPRGWRLGLAVTAAAVGLAVVSVPAQGPVTGAPDTTLPIRVNNPTRLPGWKLAAERIAIGLGYKPCLALLPDGELVMVALFNDSSQGFREWTGLWRSGDGGRTWTERAEVKGLIGREQFLTCTGDGILFATCHLLPQDRNNPDGYTHSYLHRSTDGGRSWERTRITVDGVPANTGSTLSRNVLELDDGSLLLGVGVNTYEKGRVAHVWRSTDRGKTWDHGERVHPGNFGDREYHNWDGFFSEDFNFLRKNGTWLHIIRCGPPSPMHPMRDGRPVPSGDDSIDRMLRCESADRGRTWSELRDFGPYAAHYPRLLRLQDGRVLLTFTQRGVTYPIGLQAIVSTDDGETWDFVADRIVIEAKTPWNGVSGGGFGNTVQLADGTLVSCYSYQDRYTYWNYEGNTTKIEVVRWRLP